MITNQVSRATVIHPALAFLLLSIPAILSALLTPISDCDEVFNYWEPLHYLLFGYAFQTWEYSPVFALRSYAYLFPHAAVVRFALLLHSYLPIAISAFLPTAKIFAFYALRIALALLNAAAQTMLYTATPHQFPAKSISTLYLIFSIFSPAIVRSSIEFLPSSFAMLSLTVATAFWFRNKLFPAVFFVALAALLGWVFAAALAIPMAFHILLRPRGFVTFSINAAVSAFLILSFMIPIDSYYFGRLVIAPLNHVLYNVFPDPGAGSHLFGEEHWYFYPLNLILNTNITAILHVSFPIVVLLTAFFKRHTTLQTWKRIVYLSPTYIIMPIFLAQPHKEERFLAPCYPFIALVAAVAVSDWLDLLLGPVPKPLIPGKDKTPPRVYRYGYLRTPVCAALVLISCILGSSRFIMQIHSFRAPLQIYHHLSQHLMQHGEEHVNICVGKEWYRFPSNFFIPSKQHHLRFIRAGFTGLLPKPFEQSANATRIIPQGMNQFNREDAVQFYDWAQGVGCHYHIDLQLNARTDWEGDKESPILSEHAQVLMRSRFLDSNQSPSGIRAFYIPWMLQRLVYGEYVLIRNTQLVPS